MRRHDLCGFILGLFLVFTTIDSSMAQVSQDPVRISEIRIDGNRRVAAGTVQSYLPVRVGDLTSPGSLSNALSRLYDTNLFQDIKLDMDGSVLIVRVVENPIINRVNIEGNDVFRMNDCLKSSMYSRGAFITEKWPWMRHVSYLTFIVLVGVLLR